MGFTFGSKIQKNIHELHAFLNNPRVKLFSIDDVTASFYGRVYTTLRNKGKPIPTNDLWIAALTLQHGFKLCSLDAHFSEIENLIIQRKIEFMNQQYSILTSTNPKIR